ncbi:arginine--tRNA ligase [Candidatus Methylopumilus rimovensis]|uniref:Arginine--tRNA ligase n=1 Tax=Candidatus Methylopumilus rimovensis TaxID=2588535 RepID=A0AAF1D7U8_9PROT|nr:arginine--tRNA ligase [Candidatus Methylopumilus rimovensis]QDD14085.1 arginine--tRNA ligase [Candidatus Methylopumilus rimovensis]
MKSHLLQLLLPVAQSIHPEILANSIQLDRPKSIEHGDFSTNLAMMLAKPLKKNPRELAALIIEKLPSSPFIEKVEIAGAGFINFYFNERARTFIIHEILKNPEAYGQNTSGHDENGKPQKIQIEFVSANPTGPLHVGHGRGAAIGDSLARLLKFNGWDVTREFYYNDAGAQIDNLTKSVHARCHNMDPSDPAFPEDGYRGEYIVEIANTFLNKESIECEGKTIKASGNINDLESIRQFSVAYLRHEQDQDLNAFQIKFDVFTLESSFYQNGQIEKVVASLIKNGFTYEEDNALWLKTTAFGDDKNRVMKKSDGSYTYFIPDVAYHLNKWERGFKRVINEQGSDHHSTITRVRAGLQSLKLGIPETYPEYVLHQMITVMKGGEEVKLSKRAGSYVTLRDLIDEVGCDATRYFLVARKPDSQLVFDIDLAKTQNSDNPVYYIQYAHARIAGVLKQWGGDIDQLIKVNVDNLKSSQELMLIKRLSEFPEIVLHAGVELAPHTIANYLKDCAADLHSYYNDTKFLVENEDEKLARLSLIRATQVVLKNGLDLLGVNAPEKM